MNTVFLFLNGVCRHEPLKRVQSQNNYFLNGVCRHELLVKSTVEHIFFLNGVCRHELRGSLKGIFYAGDVRSANVQTTPILTGNSMYIYDGTPNSTSTGGCYFYLGELE